AIAGAPLRGPCRRGSRNHRAHHAEAGPAARRGRPPAPARTGGAPGHRVHARAGPEGAHARGSAAHRGEPPAPDARAPRPTPGAPGDPAADAPEATGEDTPSVDAAIPTLPAAASPDDAPPAPLPTPAPAPVPRFVELSLEDAGGEDTMEIPVELPRVAETKP